MPDDEAKLIQDTLNGDRSAFAELVRRHQNRLYNTVYRLVGHAEDAEDIVQEAFFNAFEALAKFQGGSQFFTWLYRIAVNAAISRGRRRKTMASLDGAAEPIDQSFGHRPGDAIERSEDEARIQAALSQVTPDFRGVLVARDIDGMKYEEIAEVFELPIGTVRSRIHRGRLELRTLLAPETTLVIDEPP